MVRVEAICSVPPPQSRISPTAGNEHGALSRTSGDHHRWRRTHRIGNGSASRFGRRKGGLRRPHQGSSRGGRSEEHTSELKSLMRRSYAVFGLKKKRKNET